jgi:hypothetical protein
MEHLGGQGILKGPEKQAPKVSAHDFYSTLHTFKVPPAPKVSIPKSQYTLLRSRLPQKSVHKIVGTDFLEFRSGPEGPKSHEHDGSHEVFIFIFFVQYFTKGPGGPKPYEHDGSHEVSFLKV